eukprot:1408869-Prorocentrum_lima.AAC.1
MYDSWIVAGAPANGIQSSVVDARSKMADHFASGEGPTLLRQPGGDQKREGLPVEDGTFEEE